MNLVGEGSGHRKAFGTHSCEKAGWRKFGKVQVLGAVGIVIAP